MQIQRTHVTQSAAGALMAALAKGEKTDGIGFQRQLAETIDAVAPRRETSRGRQDPVDDAAVARKRRSPKETDTADAARTDRSDDIAPAASRVDEPAAGRAESSATSAPVDEGASGRADAGAAQPGDDVAGETASDATVVEEKVATPDSGDPTNAAASSQEDSGEVNGPAGVDQAAMALLNSPVVRSQATGPADRSQASEADPEQRVVVPQRATAEPLATEPQDMTAQIAAAAAAQEPTATLEPTAALGQAALSDEAPLKAKRAVTRRAESPQDRSEVVARVRTDRTSETSVEAESKPAESAFKQAMRSLSLQSRQVQAEVVALNVVVPSASTTADSQPEGSALRELTDVPLLRMAGPAGLAGDRTEASAVDQAEQIERIARVIRASISRGGSRVSLQLEPRDLGRLRVQMQIRGSELVARFETETETARLWLQQGMHQLREGLAAEGIRLVEATVENQAAEDNPAGHQAGGQAGDFASGNQEAAQQGQDHGASHEAPGAEPDVPQWAEVPAGEDNVNVVA